MKTEMWPQKTPKEKIWATFDFRRALASGETIVSVEMTVTLKGGSDDSPESILSTRTILGGRVMQRVQGGAVGAAYLLVCLATTSDDRDLELAGIIPVG